jgi:4-amino-4-deoxy-L-arabinose transferase-like glycosyltransferase
VKLSRAALGDSPFALRVLPALAAGGVAVLAALMARELGGRRLAQLTASVTAGSGVVLAAAHLAGPTIYDLLAWSVIALLVMRVAGGGSDRLWLAVGVAVGVAVLNKETVLLLVLALLVGLAIDRRMRLLGSGWVAVGAVAAALIALPLLLWQARHSFPSLEMSSNLRREHSGLGPAIAFLPLQLVLPGWWTAPVWIGGLVALLRDPRLRHARMFGWAYLLLTAWTLVTIPDRPYYVAGLYPVLLAVGAVVVERRLAGRLRARLVTLAVVGIVVDLPVLLPVLPASALATVPLQKLNYNLGETIGWPQLVQTVAAARSTLPEPATAVVLTANYGEAGAVEEYGGRYGLGTAYSAHNNYWWWGPPPEAAQAVVAVGYSPARLAPYFDRVRLVARIQNGAGVDNDERGQPVLVCEGRRMSWAQLWPRLRHYG